MKILNVLDYLNNNEVEFVYCGREDLDIEGFCPLDNLSSNCITWIRDIKKSDLSKLEQYCNLLIVCNASNELLNKNINYITTEDPHSVFFSLIEKFFCENKSKERISPTAIVETNKIGKNVTIGEYCYIGKDVEIRDNVTIMNNVTIECKAIIGNNCTIYSGVVIGVDGYGYYTNIKGHQSRVPHLGGVIIGNDVEIGANTCIAKGCLGDTVINDGVKIDNLCHIAHNVIIGNRSKIVATTVLGGSSVIGDDVWVAPGVVIKNQAKVGNGSLVGMGAVVTKDVSANKVVAGIPAKVLKDNQ